MWSFDMAGALFRVGRRRSRKGRKIFKRLDHWQKLISDTVDQGIYDPSNE